MLEIYGDGEDEEMECKKLKKNLPNNIPTMQTFK